MAWRVAWEVGWEDNWGGALEGSWDAFRGSLECLSDSVWGIQWRAYWQSSVVSFGEVFESILGIPLGVQLATFIRGGMASSEGSIGICSLLDWSMHARFGHVARYK